MYRGVQIDPVLRRMHITAPAFDILLNVDDHYYHARKSVSVRRCLIKIN